MSVWFWLILAAAGCFAQKLVGYLVPSQRLENPTFSRVAAAVTVGLLSALVVTQTFATGGSLVVDARLAAVAVAAVALWRKAPFIVVVLLGALTAAALRALGLAA